METEKSKHLVVYKYGLRDFVCTHVGMDVGKLNDAGDVINKSQDFFCRYTVQVYRFHMPYIFHQKYFFGNRIFNEKELILDIVKYIVLTFEN